MGLGRFDEDGGGSYDGGFTGDWDGPADFGDSSTVEAAPDRMLSVIRGRSRISWRFAQGPLVSTPTT